MKRAVLIEEFDRVGHWYGHTWYEARLADGQEIMIAQHWRDLISITTGLLVIEPVSESPDPLDKRKYWRIVE